MPLYEYVSKAGKKIEKILPIDPPDFLTVEGEVFKRAPSKAAFILKGNGWAKTGYSGSTPRG